MRRALTVAAFLAVYNNVLNLLPPPGRLYVPVNLTVAAALLAVGRRGGLDAEALGIDRDRLGSGLRVGAAAAAVVAAGLAVASALPAAAPYLHDRRVTELDGGQLAYQTLVRIPFGTVLLEEVAFRGVLSGLLARQRGIKTAVLGSSAVFGIWHVTPTIATLRINDQLGDPLVTAGTVLSAVVVTAAAGVVFCWLRLRSGSLAAPVVAHTATNALATLAANAVARAG